MNARNESRLHKLAMVSLASILTFAPAAFAADETAGSSSAPAPAPAKPADTDLSRRVLETLSRSSTAAPAATNPATNTPTTPAPATSPAPATGPISADPLTPGSAPSRIAPLPAPAPGTPAPGTPGTAAPAAPGTPGTPGTPGGPAAPAVGFTPVTTLAPAPAPAPGSAPAPSATSAPSLGASSVPTTPAPGTPATASPAAIPATILTPASSLTPAPASPSVASASTYTIKAGDTFVSIAAAKLGDEKYWSAIAQANPLVDPTRLKIGQVIRLPDLQTFAAQRQQQLDQVKTTAATSNRDSTVLVQPGDTLSHIADRVYGKSSLWHLIFKANRDILDSPDDVAPGMKLRIPPAPPAPAPAPASSTSSSSSSSSAPASR